MTTDRIQKRIEAFLDEADAAASRGEWQAVAEKARAVLAIDPENQDAPALLRAALANLEDTPPAVAAPTPPLPARTAQPASFAGGRYEVRRFLGEGGKKRVFLAHDTRLDRDVAFALIKTEGLDEVGRERIVREAQAMGRLGAHPHIVTIFEIGEEAPSTGSGQAGSPYVVNELLVGGDIEGEVEKAGGALPLGRTLEIAKGVARGLAFAHERGIVHRDLKPGNVWLTAEGTAKIGDFGLAVSLDRSRLTQHGMMVGTVAYMPPEQALGGEVTPQADLYSLGAMLYELVTGRPPFQADDPTAVISQHINTPPVAPSWHSEHCPPDLEALILRLLAKVPADRPASASEVLTALEAVDPEARSASHSDSSANPLDRLARGVFVGRERELERLRAAFDDAFSGRGSVVMLVGEPGIGKTRTVQELSTYARMRGAKVLWGRAHEASGAPAYWPWTQAARDYRAQTPDEVRRRQYEPYAVELQRILPNLRTLFPGLPDPPPVDSEEGQFHLFDALTSFLRDVTVETPLVVVLDDLHWADRSTLRMLTHLAREIGMARLLVVGTYRDTDLDRQHPLSQALGELNREQLFTRVLLRGLAESETRAYVEASAHVQPSADLVRRIHQETEGNPFFLSEVVRLMAEEGSLSKDSLSGISIPEGVKEALGRRLDRLSPEANELLSVAAVVGRECSHQLLAALIDLDDDTLLRLVEESLAARVLEETGVPGEYGFTHALMQDALYAELSTARRVRMHARVAETLESLYGENLDGRGAELARHFGEAAVMNPGLADKAVRYAELAARQAETVGAWDEAAEWYQRAVVGLDGGNAAREGDLWIAVSICSRNAAGPISDPYSAFMRGVEAYRRADAPRSFAAGVVRGLAGVVMGADRRPYWGIVREAMTALGDEQSPEACHLLALLSFAELTPAGDALAERARTMGVSLGLAGSSWPWILEEREQVKLSERGDYAAVAELGIAMHERLVSLGSAVMPAVAATPLRRSVQGLLAAGEIGRAEPLLERLARFAEDRRIPSVREITRAFFARLALCRNDRATFDEYVASTPNFRITRLAVEDALARDDRQTVKQLLADLSRANLEAEESWTVSLNMQLLFLEGRRDESQRLFGQWLSLVTGVAASAELSLSRSLYVSGVLPVIWFGDDRVVETTYSELEQRTDIRFPPFGGEAVDVARGLLTLRLGDVDAAERHYLDGLEWARRPDVRFGLVEGRCLQGLADVAEVRGDHALALEHLDAAAAKFAEYGAKLYLDQVLAKKEFLKA